MPPDAKTARKTAHLMRGELDWIVMKSMEKDRNRRYETAESLANDILRYLADEPVAAGPPGKPLSARQVHCAAIAFSSPPAPPSCFPSSSA